MGVLLKAALFKGVLVMYYLRLFNVVLILLVVND